MVDDDTSGVTRSQAAAAPRARYHSPRRQEQAAATRDAIVAAAGRVFAARGYAATTMATIAAEAEVSVKTVHTLADKPQLLLMAVDVAIAGDNERVPVAERAFFERLLSSTDREAWLRSAAESAAETLLRLYPIYRAFEQAAATDDALRAHWRDYQHRRRTDVARLVNGMVATGGPLPGPVAEALVDSLWALLTWHPVALLVEERGWTRSQLVDWLAHVLAALVPAPSADL